MVIRVEQCAKFEAIPSIMPRNPQFDPFHQFKIGQEWRVERIKTHVCPDHWIAIRHQNMIYKVSAPPKDVKWVRLDCLRNRLFRRTSKKTSKLRVTGPCAGNPPVTEGFLSQSTTNAANFSIWLRYHALYSSHFCRHPNRVTKPGNENMQRQWVPL